ncbi:uncharacterized protein NECHADRAFT_68825 [Fusarium vanettenii 77-13-4]|uniref:Azaphilone pigments biosynthesis cluster protein L N-terminal domain-containing protein n=1 Tax=Fusarium vanettenii (strain ATCC MYA-4622 / CBS 123669 / FGSC 9596 / NRRL 45880 / 77-13-4) TaxID=660122 RepID=C7Z7Y9_FUSV7|nr:uncharacterized protein NECHADRAFT_68825 [Fusarium vanettenii 77-13-4]EEU39907.1 hypothetical protein NECHADRAFT_68825 [Fusarium vanettenii 77-13-4]
MAEPVGLASAILALGTFALKASVSLYDDVNTFRNHPKRVRDLLEELNALRGVLEMLMETAGAATDVNFSALHIPLQRCGEACKEFGQELAKCCARSNADRTSFRDWAKMKYMGNDIDDFRQQLASYKSTINIALIDASLRASSITAKTLDGHKELIRNATDDLEAHLESINEKLEAMIDRTVPASDTDAADLCRIQNERASTEKGLQICRQLSDHIKEIQLNHAGRGKDLPRILDSGLLPDRIVSESLQQCTGSLSVATEQLERLQRKLMDQLMAKSRSAMAEEDGADLERLRSELETTRQSIMICHQVDMRLQQNVSVIENYATGDQTVQFLASTNEKTINGKNSGFGWAQRQIGGHFDNETVRQLSQDAFKPVTRYGKSDESQSQDQTPSHPRPIPNDQDVSKFSDRWGGGHRLISTSCSDRAVQISPVPNQDLPSGSSTGKQKSPSR